MIDVINYPDKSNYLLKDSGGESIEILVTSHFGKSSGLAPFLSLT